MATRRKPRSVREYLDGKNKELCNLLDACLKTVSKPERLEEAPLNQVASVMFSVIDRFGELGRGEDSETLTKLIEGLKEK